MVTLNTMLIDNNGCCVSVKELLALMCKTCCDVTNIFSIVGALLGTINPGDTVTFQDCNGTTIGTASPGDTVIMQDCNGVTIGAFCV